MWYNLWVGFQWGSDMARETVETYNRVDKGAQCVMAMYPNVELEMFYIAVDLVVAWRSTGVPLGMLQQPLRLRQ